MAKCEISIEDIPGGGVRIVATPSFAVVAQMVNSGGHGLTSAHSYHMHLLRRALEFEKVPTSQSKILIPRLKS